MSRDRRSLDVRVALLRAFVLGTLACLCLGLYSFQIVQGDKYIRLAAENRLRLIRTSPPRGMIYDANGLSLAESIRMFEIRGYPLDLRKEGIMDLVAALFRRHGIPLDAPTLMDSMNRQFWAPYRAVTLVSNLTLSQVADLVGDPGFLPQLFPQPVWRRIYPAGLLAAHVTGYVAEITREELLARQDQGYGGGDQVGKVGIEAFFEETLRGEMGEEAVEVDARGRRQRQIAYRSPKPGEDIRLTFDLGAQRVASDLMAGKKGVLLAMDVHSGGVKVLCSIPTYDVNPLTWGVTPSEWARINRDPDRPMLNRAIGGNYPPGSPFKVVPAFAGLAEAVISPRTHVYCPGTFAVGNRVFKCWRRGGHGSVNIHRALRDSCDTFFYQVGLWLGIDRLSRWAARFGVGALSGIDLPGEVGGTLGGEVWKRARLKERWYQGDTANYSIGQGFVLMTPLQVARMYAAVANGGYLVTPHLNRASDGLSVDMKLPRDVLHLVQRGLEDVVEGGTGSQARRFGIAVAGKTGTAQNPHGEDHAWFVGYAPVGNPRFVAVALVEGGGHGGAVAAPLVGELLAYLCREETGREIQR